MFSISSTEFSDFPAFVEKVTALRGRENTSDQDSETHALRTWCAERGFLFHFSKTPSGVFYTLKYDRAKLTESQYESLGRFRSIVLDGNGRVCCVAPPKMLKLTDEMKALSVNSAAGHLTAEELVEGIMVNLFWRATAGQGEANSGGGDGKWYIATKSCVGEVSYDHIIEAQAEAQLQDGTGDGTGAGAVAPTFQKLNVQEVLRRRICDVLSLLPGGLESIPKEYCYSLVIQHPKNQIVNVITVPALYLVAVYQLADASASAGSAEAAAEAAAGAAGVNVIRINRDIFSGNFGGSVSHMPSALSCISADVGGEGEDTVVTATFTPHTVDDYCNMYASMDTRSVSLAGVVFVDKDTGFCYKKRNPKYESVKKRKGMEQKLMAQYLQMRKDRGIDEYLKYHPQHSRAFRQFRDRLHDYTQRLYDAYIAHYVKKDVKPLKEYDRELKTHMYKLHYDVYLATMKESGAFVTKHTVINYVNQLAAAQQLACLNAGSGATAVTTSAITETYSADAPQKRKPFQRKPIERSKPGMATSGGGGDAETKSGFRSAKPSRGGRMVPSLTVQIPKSDENHERGEGFIQLKGAKTTGSVKVHNQFAGLDVE
jgi:hypothetical protein